MVLMFTLWSFGDKFAGNVSFFFFLAEQLLGKTASFSSDKNQTNVLYKLVIYISRWALISYAIMNSTNDNDQFSNVAVVFEVPCRKLLYD